MRSDHRVYCGVDVHKDFLTVALVDGADMSKLRFENTTDGILALKAWLRTCHCQKIAMESTGIFWLPLYMALETEVQWEVIVANAYQVKQIPGRKTDTSDAEWLAVLCAKGLIRPSYIPPRDLRELRELTRSRVKLVQTQTAFKNRVHKILKRANIRLADAFSHIFGKASLLVLGGLMEGKSPEELLKEHATNRVITKKKAGLERSIKGALSEMDVFLLQKYLRVLKLLDEELRELEAAITERLETLREQEKAVQLLMTVPGIGFTTASAIIAEIVDIERFPSAKHLISWSGLAPSVSQSGGKVRGGRITKRGSKYLRRVMVQVAHSAKRVRNSQLRDFYFRVRSRRGEKVAVVALARKLLGIIYHLLKWNEVYREVKFKKVVRIPLGKKGLYTDFSLLEMISVLREAGYIVQRNIS